MIVRAATRAIIETDDRPVLIVAPVPIIAVARRHEAVPTVMVGERVVACDAFRPANANLVIEILAELGERKVAAVGAAVGRIGNRTSEKRSGGQQDQHGCALGYALAHGNRRGSF